MVEKCKTEHRVLVSGASRGIGYAIAKTYSSAGAQVFGLKSNAKSEKHRFCSKWFDVDLSRLDEIHDFIHELSSLQPNVLINNAGINTINSFTDISEDEFMKIQAVNVFAPFMLCKAVLPFMVENSWGRIVNIGSIWGLIGKEFRASYSASKFAIDGITLAISAEYSRSGILANCVSPGFTNTELTQSVLGEEGIKRVCENIPQRRLAKPSEIAELVYWLGSEKNSYVAGQNFAIDGGFSRVG